MALMLSPLSVGLGPSRSSGRALVEVRHVRRGLVLILILPRVEARPWRAIGLSLLLSLSPILLLGNSWVGSGEVTRNRDRCRALWTAIWTRAVLSVVIRRGSGRLTDSLTSGLRRRCSTGRAILISLGSPGWGALL